MSENTGMSLEFECKGGDYLLEEMKCLRGLINTWVEQISRLEIYTMSSFGAIVYFYVNYRGRSALVDTLLQFVPLVLAVLIMLRGMILSHRIETADEYLKSVESKFRREGAWVTFFRSQYTRKEIWRSLKVAFFWMRITDRMLITIVFIIFGLLVLFCMPLLLTQDAKSKTIQRISGASLTMIEGNQKTSAESRTLTGENCAPG
jgi:hypothetical protein